MSDQTTRSDGFGTEGGSGSASGSNSQGASDPASADQQSSSANEPQSAAERAGFCQDCGKPLTSATVRTVGTGVFCEPCLDARVAATLPNQGYGPPNQGYTTPPFTPVPPQAVDPDEPRPVLAAILGFIPGVGAMYNGQFAKGIVHLAIFAILVSLSDNVNGIFGLFVAGWEFYMVFEAYHTALARRDGLPLPNAFGFNDIGERMGFGKSWAAGSSRPSPNSVPPPPPGQPAGGDPSAGYGGDPAAGYGYVPTGTNPAANARPATPDWIGYIPPTAFASAPPAPPVEPSAANQPFGAWGPTPYTETYTGSPQAYEPLQGRPDVSGRHFPTSALWLIGLGVLVLLANLLPDWKLTERWWPPVLFACLSVWTFTRRRRPGTRLVCMLRWPVLLMVLAVMLALHAAYFEVTTALTVAVLLIAYGALLLLERAAGPAPIYGPPAASAFYPASAAAADPREEEARSRAAWAAAKAAGVNSTAEGNNAGSGEEPR